MNWKEGEQRDEDDSGSGGAHREHGEPAGRWVHMAEVRPERHSWLEIPQVIKVLYKLN